VASTLSRFIIFLCLFVFLLLSLLLPRSFSGKTAEPEQEQEQEQGHEARQKKAKSQWNTSILGFSPHTTHPQNRYFSLEKI
jgi:hypothetical protein